MYGGNFREDFQVLITPVLPLYPPIREAERDSNRAPVQSFAQIDHAGGSQLQHLVGCPVEANGLGCSLQLSIDFLRRPEQLINEAWESPASIFCPIRVFHDRVSIVLAAHNRGGFNYEVHRG